MSAHGNLSPEQIRSQLNHPVIDADGHWIEYGPVFAEQLRKGGGDQAAEGFLSVGQSTREALSLSVADRQRRRISQEAFWARPEKDTRDRATGMFPKLLYPRPAEVGRRF